MRYYTLLEKEKEVVAVSIDGENYVVLPEYKDMTELIYAGGISKESQKALFDKAGSIESQKSLSGSGVKILAPIVRPRQDVICLGINYAAHSVEAAKFSNEAFGGERPYPIFFAKRVNYAPGPEDYIPRYEGLVDSLDYECELGVIIGKEAKNVKKEDVADYIFGYTIVNDVSARNLQTRHKQWYFGKSLDGFTPMGPCILSADEVGFPPKLGISCKVNGETRQDSTTDLLITTIPEIIEMLSSGMSLLPGTIIATGTPAGVGMGMTPPTFLNSGDVVECEIEKIGVLRNIVK